MSVHATAAPIECSTENSLISVAKSPLDAHIDRELRNALGFLGKLIPPRYLRQRFDASLDSFAAQLQNYDLDVGRRGLFRASRQMLMRTIPRPTFLDREPIPKTGPLLVVANHPGLHDALALATCMQRNDLRIVAKTQSYWTALPHIADQLIFLDRRAGGFCHGARLAIRHLNDGGALLVFPRGEIEVDPLCFPKIETNLQLWSRTPEWLASVVDELTIMPAAVGGVLSRAAMRHPLTWFRFHRRDRRWLAATLQFLLQQNDDVMLHVAFGSPIRTKGANGRLDQRQLRQHIHQAVDQQLDRLRTASRTAFRSAIHNRPATNRINGFHRRDQPTESPKLFSWPRIPDNQR